jgi:hypothetical protein
MPDIGHSVYILFVLPFLTLRIQIYIQMLPQIPQLFVVGRQYHPPLLLKLLI